MKNLFWVPLMLALAGALLLGGCGQPAPSQTTATAPTASPTVAPALTTAPTPTPSSVAVKPIELRFTSPQPPASKLAQVDKQWADMINQKSGGKVKITYYPAESLSKQVDTYRSVQTGIADIGYYGIGSTNPFFNELNRVLGLPFMGISSMEMAGPIQEKLWAKFPEMMVEWPGLKVMGPRAMPGFHFHTTKKLVHVPDDVKGMKVIATGNTADQLKMIGTVPVVLGLGDWYMSLDRGMVEGILTHFPVANIFKLLDLLKYHLIFGDFGSQASMDCYIWNLDTWNKLPADMQKVVEDATRWRVDEMVKADKGEIQAALDYAKKRGNTFTYATPEEMKVWQDAFKPIHEKWIADTEAMGGRPARKVFDEAVKLIKEAATSK